MSTRNCKGTSLSTSGKMSCVSRSKNSRYLIPVNRSGKRTGPISRSPTIPVQTFIENVVWCLASRMACGFACAQIGTLWKLQIPSRVNFTSSVNNSFHRNCCCRTHCSKNHWQNLTRRGKSSGFRPRTRCRWYGYSRSSCSILQTPSAADIVRVLVPGLAAIWARIRCSCRTVVAVRGLPFNCGNEFASFPQTLRYAPKRFGYIEVDDSGMFLDTDFLPHAHCHWHKSRSECLSSQQTCSLWPPSWIK